MKYSFSIYRSIIPTNNVGAPYPRPTAKDQFVDEFGFGSGDFLLRTPTNVEELPTFVKIEGTKGRAKRDNLQLLKPRMLTTCHVPDRHKSFDILVQSVLIHHRWGLPEELSKGDKGNIKSVSMDDTKPQLISAAGARKYLTTRRGLSRKSLMRYKRTTINQNFPCSG